jgi:hypothetical protein
LENKWEKMNILPIHKIEDSKSGPDPSHHERYAVMCGDLAKILVFHPISSDCFQSDCLYCGMKNSIMDCLFKDPLHYESHVCPSCGPFYREDKVPYHYHGTTMTLFLNAPEYRPLSD